MGGGGIMIWGGVGYWGKMEIKFIIYNKSILKRSTFKLTRARRELPEINTFFNVMTAHRESKVKQYFANRKIRVLTEWPAKSPNLNIIENY